MEPAVVQEYQPGQPKQRRRLLGMLKLTRRLGS